MTRLDVDEHGIGTGTNSIIATHFSGRNSG
jgi:hypothetical protein